MSDVKRKVIDLLKTPQLSSLATVTLDGKPKNQISSTPERSNS